MSIPGDLDLDFEQLFKLCLKSMEVVNLHPGLPRTKLWFFRSFIQHSVYTLVLAVVLSNVFIAAKSGHFSASCRHGILCVVYFVVTAKHISVIKNRKLIFSFLELIKNDYKADLSYDEKLIVFKYAMTARKILVFWLFMTGTAGALFPIKHIILEVSNKLQTNKFELIEVYPLTYPAPIEDNKFHPLIFLSLFILFIYYCGYTALTYTGMVPFVLICITHSCGQLEIAAKRIKELDIENIEEFQIKVKSIVKILQHVYNFLDELNVVFGVIYEVIMKAATVGLPLCMWEFRSAFDCGEVNVEFVALCIAGAWLAITPCYYSQILMEKGNDIAIQIYFCGWERVFNQSVRQSVLIILHRAQKPVALKTLFHELGTEAITDLFHQAYTIFNLMNAAWT